MEYGGQRNFGLDLGQKKVYSDMNDNPKDSISSTMSEKKNLDPGEDYAVMAENNETALGDFDGDGELEFQKISGDYHSAPSGGTALTNKQLPSKSYIFPQTKKMYIKDPEFLKQMGVTASKGGVSPADISKRFNMMDDKKVLDDPFADPISKKTAKLNKENKEAKLQKLAEYVEQMKGNPQGKPDTRGSLATMAYGGYYLPKAEDGYYNANDVVPYKGGRTWYGSHMPTGKTNEYRGTQEDINQWNNYIPGYSAMDNKSAQQAAYRWTLQNDPGQLDKMWQTSGLNTQGRNMRNTGEFSNFTNPDGTMKNKQLTNEQLMDLERAYTDDIYGGRNLTPSRHRLPGQPIMAPRNSHNMGTPPGILNRPMSIPQPIPDTTPGEDAVVDTHQDTKTGQTTTPAKGNPYNLPYNGIQMAQTLDAFSRPVKGYFDKPFVPEMVGTQAMYDEPNYDPLLSANATQMEAMNQYANPAAARAMASYNPQLMQGLEAETQRAKANNLGIYNQTAAQNAQIMNQNLLNRAQVMKNTRDNNIRTREQMDIAHKLKFNDSTNAFGKMVNDRLQMKKLNMMYPQYAVHGDLWDQLDFTKGKDFGQSSQSSGDFTFKNYLAQNPGTAKLYTSGTDKDKADIEHRFMTLQNQQENRMFKNGKNVQANTFNSYVQDMNDLTTK